MRSFFGAIKRRIHGAKNVLWFAIHTSGSKPPQNIWDSQWKHITDYLESVNDGKYRCEVLQENFEAEYKWVGGVYFQQQIVGIANSGRDCLIIDLGKECASRYGFLPEGTFKWSGGCAWNNCIYGFPRSSSELLCIDFKNGDRTIECVPLPINYSGEHHYGGVCTKEGIVYQPPRNTGSILKINLNTGEIMEIWISKKEKKFFYCGSLLHPNGLIYFFPQYKQRVMVLDPRDDKIYFIGKCISSMVFGASIALDGNIYGYSAYGTGILMIETKTNKTKMIFQDKRFGCYGSILGIYGSVLGVPGDGDLIYEFDPLTKKLSVLEKLQEKGKAKCAGAAMGPDGSIYCIPAMGTKIYVLRPERKHVIPETIIESTYINNCY